MSGHVVRNQRGRNAILLQLPDGQPRALQKGTRLIGENIDALAGFHGRADHSQRGAVAGRGQCAGVAMREDRPAVRHQRRAVAADRPADRDILLAHDPGLFGQPPANGVHRLAAQPGVQPLHAVDRPEQVDRGRAGCGQGVANGFELAVEVRRVGLLDPQRHPHRRRHADGRRAPDHHLPDRLRDLAIIPAGDVFFFERQARLVDHDDAFVRPQNGFHHEKGLC